MGEFSGERKKRHSAEKESAAPVARQVHHSSAGRPLDSSTLATMESRFGYDFGSVRVHDGPEAAGSARALNALAYTVGNDVFFGDGQYRDGTPEGQKLIAHELTHVVQQSAGHPSAEANVQNLPISDASESEAVQVENALARHESMPGVSQTGVAVMRNPDEKEDAANLAELTTKVSALVQKNYKGDYKAAFDHYAKDGSIGTDELKSLLKDAGVGNIATRGSWAEAIIKKLDTNGNKKIEWSEFEGTGSCPRLLAGSCPRPVSRPRSEMTHPALSF